MNAILTINPLCLGACKGHHSVQLLTPLHSYPSPSHSLIMRAAIFKQDINHSKYALTEESATYLTAGSPEAQVFNAIPAEGISMADLKVC